MSDVFGVYRERRFSPGRVADDAAILDATAERLRRAGVAVGMVEGEALPELRARPRLVFAMCQGADALAWLDGLDCPVINPATAIRNCFRVNLVERLAEASLPQPRWRFASTSFPTNLGPGPWLKRGDVHAMEAGDVRRIFGEEEWSKAIGDLSRRGIQRAIAQEHCEGGVYKFYGVAGGFFRAYGLPAAHAGAASRLGASAAAALDLTVYGGDGVVGPDGSLTLIDLNDWPSFSRCRDDAAAAIAAHLEEILEGKRNDGREERGTRSGSGT